MESDDLIFSACRGLLTGSAPDDLAEMMPPLYRADQ
jgi:hypothetical protein